MHSISINEWKNIIDANFSKSFTVSSFVDQHSRSSSDVASYNALSMREGKHATNYCMLRCKRLQSVPFIDNMLATKKNSTKVNKCSQILIFDKVYIAEFPMNFQHEFETTLCWFCKEVDVPVDLIINGFSAQKKLSIK